MTVKTTTLLTLALSVFTWNRTVVAQAYNSSGAELILEYADSIALNDLDGDGVITDMDFSIWTIERVFSREVPDANCDGLVDLSDAVLAVARELAGLTADFDDSTLVDGTDLNYVFNQIGLEDVAAADGDINGDGFVDGLDVVDAVGKWGQQPTANPITIATTLLAPLVNLEGVAVPSQLPISPVCPAPETCGSARCKGKCQNSATGVSWTYRLFMIGFCGSQFEANACCQIATAVACTCSPDEFEFSCWVNGQGTFIACLLATPG